MSTTDSARRREAIRASLEEARRTYHHLLDRVSDADWGRKDAGAAWSVGELLTHITSYLTVVIPRGVEAARCGKRWGGFPPFIAETPVVHWLNVLGTRWLARRESRRQIAVTYDTAHAEVLALLDEIRDDEWKRATYTLGQEMTIEDIFRVHAEHVREHTPLIESAIGSR